MNKGAVFKDAPLLAGTGCFAKLKTLRLVNVPGVGLNTTPLKSMRLLTVIHLLAGPASVLTTIKRI